MKLKLSTLGVTAGLLLGAAVTAGTAQAQTTNSMTVANNSFETPVISNQDIFYYGDGTPNTFVTGWTVQGGIVMALDSGAAHAPLAPEDGSQYLESFAIPGNFNGATTVSQTLTNNFIPGDTYTFSLYGSPNNQVGNSISINDGATVLSSTLLSGGTANAWTLYTTTFTDVSNTDPISLDINIVPQGSVSGYYYDNASATQVSAVPEPSTWALFGVAMFCGLVVRHRISRNKEINS